MRKTKASVREGEGRGGSTRRGKIMPAFDLATRTTTQTTEAKKNNQEHTHYTRPKGTGASTASRDITRLTSLVWFRTRSDIISMYDGMDVFEASEMMTC